MFIHCELAILILALTLDGQVHSGQIFGGHEAVPHSRPYMVLLERHTHEGTQYCGGFLLNKEFVMTAAHCQARSYTVLLGVHDVHNKKHKVDSEEAYPHDDYNASELTNDIMLLKLSAKANFSKAVGAITLAGQGDDPPRSCIVSGWGRADRSNNFMCHKLMEVNVTLVDSEECANKRLYCSEGAAGPGEGDSGGPLVCEDGKAYGVVSSSKPNPAGGDTYGFTKIPDFRSWIDSIMNHDGKF